MPVIPAVIFAFLLTLFRSARNRFMLLYMAMVLGYCWYRFPSWQYPFWNSYYGPFWLMVHLVAINIATFIAYGLDKRYAIRGHSRVPEATLHLMALLGGSPGAWLGSKVFRHKTSKTSFRKRFWLIVLLQLAIIFWVFYPDYFAFQRQLNAEFAKLNPF